MAGKNSHRNAVMLKVTFVIALSLVFHYLVTTKLVPGQQSSSSAEIVESSAASSVKDKITKIAVKAPDTCANQTVGSTSGASSNVSTVVATRCGVEMAALERSLARAGYEVISWKLMDEGLSRGGKPLAKLAEELGADGLVQVNSLEKNKSKIPGGARFETSYHSSNSRGAILKPAKISPPREQVIGDQFLNPLHKSISSKTLLSVSLDATLIYVPTQQAVWFYKNAVLEPLSDDMTQEYSQLFKCGDPCLPLSAKAAPTKSSKADVVTGRVDNVAEGEIDPDAARYSQLVRQVVDDFTNRATKVIRN